MKQKKSLMRQLLEAKQNKDEDAYEDAYEDILIQLESLCVKFTKDEMKKDTTLLLADVLKKYSNNLKEYAKDLD